MLTQIGLGDFVKLEDIVRIYRDGGPESNFYGNVPHFFVCVLKSGQSGRSADFSSAEKRDKAIADLLIKLNGFIELK